MAWDESNDVYYGLDRWPVTVIFDGEAEIRREETFSEKTWTFVCKPTLLEFRNIMEAEEYLTGGGMESCGPEVCGHRMTYRSDKGFARITFTPACIYEETVRGDIRRAMEREADYLGTVESLGPKRMEIPGLHHH